MFNCCNNLVFGFRNPIIFSPFMTPVSGNGFLENLFNGFIFGMFNNLNLSWRNCISYNYQMPFNGCIFDYNQPSPAAPSFGTYDIPEMKFTTDFNYTQGYQAGAPLCTDVFQSTLNYTAAPVFAAPAVKAEPKNKNSENKAAEPDVSVSGPDKKAAEPDKNTVDVKAASPKEAPSESRLQENSFPASYAVTPDSDYAAIYNRTYTGDCINTGKVIHFKYEDANLGNRKAMKPAAKAAFDRMAAAMKRDLGFTLSYSSAYRSRNDQIRSLNNKTYNNNISVMRNRFIAVAPVGYSEHHTGYACDITIDGQNGNLENDNWQTGKLKQAYDWMKKHAAEYGFEQSFRAGNKQGVMEEAWHYRWVGDADSQRVFERARKYEGII